MSVELEDLEVGTVLWEWVAEPLTCRLVVDESRTLGGDKRKSLSIQYDFSSAVAAREMFDLLERLSRFEEEEPTFPMGPP